MAHASLATNRNNDSLRLFLSIKQESDLEEWSAWTDSLLHGHPHNPVALYLSADAKAREGKLEEAKEGFTQAIKLEEDFALAYNARGVIYGLGDDTNSALNDFRQAIHLAPELADAYVNFGVFWAHLKAPEGAVEAFDHALVINPEFALAHHGRGAVYTGIKQYAKAAQDFNRFAQLTAPPVEEITLHVTDFGINQWKKKWQMGAKFNEHPDGSKEEPNNVFGLSPEANILIPMPADSEFDTTSTAELIDKIADTILRRIEEGQAHGVTTFEVQYVQNINTPGYFSKERQAKVERFGSAAYAALNRVRNHLRRQHSQVSIDVTSGSNGTEITTKTAYLFDRGTAVDLFDGRASKEATLELITKVGEENVRLFNTFGDWPAADEHLASVISTLINIAAFHPVSLANIIKQKMGGTPATSIANLAVTTEIKKKYPKVKVYLLGRITGIEANPPQDKSFEEVVQVDHRVGNDSHISGMSKRYRHTWFIIRELLVSKDTSETVTLSRRAIVSGENLHLRGQAFEGGLIYLPLTRDEYIHVFNQYDSEDRRLQAVSDELELLERSLQTLRGDSDPANPEVNKKLEGEIKNAQTTLSILQGTILQWPGLLKAIDEEKGRHDQKVDVKSVADACERLSASLDLFLHAVRIFDGILFANASGKKLVSPEISLLPALLKDTAQSLRNGHEIFPSYTLEELGKVGLKYLPKLVDFLVKEGKLPKFYAGFPVMFGVDKFVAGGASQIGRGHLGVDEITNYLDGLSRMVTSITVFVLLPPVVPLNLRAEAARTLESAVGHLQVVGRAMTMRWFQEWANKPVQRQIVEQWVTLQERRLADGQPMVRFSEMFTDALLRQAGFTAQEVTALDQQADRLNAKQRVRLAAKKRKTQGDESPSQRVENEPERGLEECRINPNSSNCLLQIKPFLSTSLCPGPFCPEFRSGGFWWPPLCPGPACPEGSSGGGDNNDDDGDDEGDDGDDDNNGDGPPCPNPPCEGGGPHYTGGPPCPNPPCSPPCLNPPCSPPCPNPPCSPPCLNPPCRDESDSSWKPRVYFPKKKSNADSKEKEAKKPSGDSSKEEKKEMGARTKDIAYAPVDRGDWPVVASFSLFYNIGVSNAADRIGQRQ